MNSAKRVSPGDGTLLIVDSDRLGRDKLRRLLRRHGHAVHAAGDGESALELIPFLQPELILLDAALPGMGAHEVCRRLKADPAGQDIPVMLVCAGDAGARRQALRSGAVDCLAKPLCSEELLARVRSHLTLYRLQRRLDEQIDCRTAALAAANARLEREVADRRQANERFRGVLESAPDAMVLVDAQHRVVLVNSRTETLFGYGRDELLGQSMLMLMPERFRERFQCSAEVCPATRRNGLRGGNEPLFGLHRDGSEFPVEISLSPLQPAEQGYIIGAIRDVSGRLVAEAALRELAAHSDAVREEERKRIAGDIHDELGSLLTGLKMEISLLRMELGGNDGAAGRLAQMREMVEGTMRMVRQVSTQLRPAALNLGLVPALDWLVEDFCRRSAIDCRLEADAEAQLDDAQTTAIFRIVQESLTNVARHARARRIDVRLRHTGKGLDLTVADDGRGFNPAAVGGGSFGLMGIRERALALGGRAVVDSAIGAGTRVNIWIPVAGGRQ